MRIDRSLISHVALATTIIAGGLYLFLLLTRQPTAGRAGVDRSLMLAYVQTTFGIVAIVVSVIGVVVSATSANDARKSAEQSRIDAAEDRRIADQRAEKQRAEGLQDAADERARVERDRQDERARNEQRLIAQALRIAREVRAAGERYADTLDRGEQPDWVSFDSPQAKAQVARSALDALGSTGTDDPDLVYELALLRELMKGVHSGSLPSTTQERISALRTDDAKIEKAIRRIEPFQHFARQDHLPPQKVGANR